MAAIFFCRSIINKSNESLRVCKLDPLVYHKNLDSFLAAPTQWTDNPTRPNTACACACFFPLENTHTPTLNT